MQQLRSYPATDNLVNDPWPPHYPQLWEARTADQNTPTPLRPHQLTATMHPYIAVPAVALLVFRAYRSESLTPVGIITATITAVIHALHPWSVFFALLVVFFIGGTRVTKVHDYCYYLFSALIAYITPR